MIKLKDKFTAFIMRILYEIKFVFEVHNFYLYYNRLLHNKKLDL